MGIADAGPTTGQPAANTAHAMQINTTNMRIIAPSESDSGDEEAAEAEADAFSAVAVPFQQALLAPFASTTNNTVVAAAGPEQATNLGRPPPRPSSLAVLRQQTLESLADVRTELRHPVGLVVVRAMHEGGSPPRC
jgi:hypothetical protein